MSEQDNPDSEPEREMRPPEKVAYMRGRRAMAKSIISRCLSELGYRYSQGEFMSLASAAVEREAVIATLREVCEKHGDNDWDEHLHLADVIDKHLLPHLESQWTDRAALIHQVNNLHRENAAIVARLCGRPEKAQESAIPSDQERPEPPSPWRWELAKGLVDANGDSVIRADEFGAETPASNNAGQLLRLAPEMEALLRGLEWSGSSKDPRYPDHHVCPECAAEEMTLPHGAPEPHLGGCKLGALLAAVAPARKAT